MCSMKCFAKYSIKVVTRQHWIQRITFAADTNAACSHTYSVTPSETVPSLLTKWWRRRNMQISDTNMQRTGDKSAVIGQLLVQERHVTNHIHTFQSLHNVIMVVVEILL